MIGARFVGPYSLLLGSLILLAAGMPAMLSLAGAEGAGGMQILTVGVMMAGVYSVSRSRRLLFIGVALAVPSLAVELVAVVTDASWAVAVNLATSATFLAFNAGAILYTLLRRYEVTADTILGGICVYLLVAFVFAFIYALIEYVSPGSFLLGPEDADLGIIVPGKLVYLEPQLIYFSFVALTTVGFGDIRPATEVAQMFSAAEAVIGQLYLVVFIARLVGLHISQAMGDQT